MRKNLDGVSFFGISIQVFCLYYECFYQNKNGEVLIVTLRRKPNRFELDAWLGLLYYFMQSHRIYTLNWSFQSVGRFIAVRLTTPILF